LIQAPLQTHAAIHDLVVQAHTPTSDAMLTSVHASYNQPAYHFVTTEVTWRPCAVRCGTPWRYLGIEAGTRGLLSRTVDTETLTHFVALGLFVRLGDAPRISATRGATAEDRPIKR